MALVLSTDDIRRVGDIVRLLVTPGEHATVDEWRHSANESLKALTGADSAGFLLPGVGRVAMFSQDHDPDQLSLYTDIPVPNHADGRPIWGSIVRMRAGTLAEAYGAEYRQRYLKSAYYNEYAGANGAHDPLHLTCAFVGDEGRQASVGSIQLWHSSPRGRLFGERELNIVRLVYPAFEAGVKAYGTLTSHQSGIVHALDSLASSAAMFDFQRREAHRTPSLVALLARDACGATSIQAAIRAAVDELITTGLSDRSPSVPAGKRVLRQVRTPLNAYDVSGFLAGQHGADARPMIVVIVECERRATDVESLSAQFGLTPSETRVAHLLREGKSNADIASALGVSTHTIRRHTEAVFAKLGVRSRSEAAARLRP